MKRNLWALAALILFLSGFAFGQTAADQEYIKAMQQSDGCSIVAGLKSFLSQHAGKGSQYEHFAWAYLCLTDCKSKTAQESIEAGEKALDMPALNDETRLSVLVKLQDLYLASGQTDKARAFGQKVVDFAKAKRDKEPAEAAKWTGVMGAGHFMIGKSLEKANDLPGAADAYIQSYELLKNPKIAAILKRIGKSLYDSKRFAEAEKIFRSFYASAKDSESAIILGQTLYRGGKIDEAMQIFKEAHARKRSAELAYNIAIILANKAKTNPSHTAEAINMFIEASLLYPAQSKQSKQTLGMAQNLFIGDNKELKNIEAQIQEHVRAHQELTKTFNEKYGDKSEEDLSASEKNTLKKLNEAIAAEQAAINSLQAQQKSVVEKFSQLVAQVRNKLGR